MHHLYDDFTSAPLGWWTRQSNNVYNKEGGSEVSENKPLVSTHKALINGKGVLTGGRVAHNLVARCK